jgi:co-chaperonin GroES (HSP10)
MRLLGNRVMLRRIEIDERPHASGLFLADPYGKGSYMFTVLAVGPGRWLKHPKKDKKVFIRPEVQVGDVIFSTHWNDASVYPSWHQPHYLDGVDGHGRVILDARFCHCSFPQPETIKFKATSHL